MMLSRILDRAYHSVPKSVRQKYRLKEAIKNRLSRGQDLFLGPGAGYQWARHVMNESTLQMITRLPTTEMDALEISGERWRTRASFRSYHALHYPNFDICKGEPSETADIIFAEQVFEHLLWPYRAAINVHSMLNPGGYFLITVPFLVKIHKQPADCTRWSEQGLKYFLAEAGFPLEHVETGSWGNRDCLKANLSTWRDWVMYRPRVHSLENEELFPVVTWALARKTI